jgi:tRNA nucleotidyltransferase (CCA-adding enzyme)
MTELSNDILEAFWGYDLYYVGGCVRDRVMERMGYNYIVSKDVDFATNATPIGMITLCKSHGLNFRYTKNSIAHGTITIEGFEFTTFRKDVSCDGRNATVEFANFIEDDLSRRDITINAMAIDVWTGKLVDPFGGAQDIKDKVIRAVGNPDERLSEDTLRAIRAIRFANKFGFEIEDNLLFAIKSTDISNISVERIREEFMKILETRNSKYIEHIVYKVIPELKVLIGLDGGSRHRETVDIHSLNAMKYMMEFSDKPLNSFAALIHDIGKGYTYNNPERMFKEHEDIGANKGKEIMKRMNTFSTDEIDYVYVMIKNHMRWHFYSGSEDKIITDRAIRRAIREFPEKFDKQELVNDLIILTYVDYRSNNANTPFKVMDLSEYTERKGIFRKALKIVQEKPEVKIGDGLELDGNDLIEMGFKPSPLFNVILTDVFNKVIGEDESKKLENNKKILKKYVSDKYEK